MRAEPSIRCDGDPYPPIGCLAMPTMQRPARRGSPRVRRPGRRVRARGTGHLTRPRPAIPCRPSPRRHRPSRSRPTGPGAPDLRDEPDPEAVPADGRIDVSRPGSLRRCSRRRIDRAVRPRSGDLQPRPPRIHRAREPLLRSLRHVPGCRRVPAGCERSDRRLPTGSRIGRVPPALPRHQLLRSGRLHGEMGAHISIAGGKMDGFVKCAGRSATDA